MKNPKFLLVATRVDSVVMGTPRVVSLDEFQGLNQKASDATEGIGEWVILAEISDDLQVVSKTVSGCDNKICTYYTHYLVYYKPTEEFPVQLQHEAYHAAEEKCEAAQNRYIKWMEDHEGNSKPIPEGLEHQAARWERMVCA